VTEDHSIQKLLKTIGIIGGMSYESSTHYYERINKQVNDRIGGLNTATIIMYSVNLGEIEPMMRADKWDEISVILTDIAKNLETAGADVIVIATNTMHKLFDVIQASVSVPMIHIADTVADKCISQNIRDVGLIGTAYTMKEPFLKDRLAQKGLKVVVPDSDEKINEINRIVFEELCLGKILDSSREYYKQIIEEFASVYGAKGIILGCTEVEMLISKNDVSIPIFDTTEAHIDGIVDLIAPVSR